MREQRGPPGWPGLLRGVMSQLRPGGEAPPRAQGRPPGRGSPGPGAWKPISTCQCVGSLVSKQDNETDRQGRSRGEQWPAPPRGEATVILSTVGQSCRVIQKILAVELGILGGEL